MNLHITSIVIRREYLTRVKKKSFLITTFVVPILFAALCLLPTLIMNLTDEAGKKVAVVDRSGIVAGALESDAAVTFSDCSNLDLDYVKANLETLELDAVLAISDLDTLQKTVSADIFSTKPMGVESTDGINRRINTAMESYKVSISGIPDLAEKMAEVKSDIKVRSFTIDKEGKEKVAESGVYMILSMVLGMIIYLFITLFGAMVMSSVIEEKSSRVVEVLVSSVKATELMFGKIIGVALVAITQFLLWIVLTFAIVGVVGSVSGDSLLGGSDPTEMAQQMGVDSQMAGQVTEAAAQSDASVILNTLANIDYGRILVCFFIFFIFGYMLYASLYAAVGSAVENEGDSQQLQLPITIPLMIGFFIAIYTFKAPDSAIAFWGSMIPFTSPIVMLARLPFDVPFWEIALSVAILVVTTVFGAWLSAKIYKVGILMFGKKSSWSDLWKWLKQK